MTFVNTNVVALMAHLCRKVGTRNRNTRGALIIGSAQPGTETPVERLSLGLRINGAAEKWLCSLVAGVSNVPNKFIWRFGSANLAANSHFAQ